MIGMSADDPEITPPEKYRYDLCLTLETPVRPAGEIGSGAIPSGLYAVHHCVGEIEAFARAWNYFFKVWLPQSGYRPSGKPALEIFNSIPEEIDWERFDIDCCVPLDPIPGLSDF